MATKVCPRCGREFECRHNADCFCMKYTLTEDTRKFLAEKYDNCLCEDCLKLYAENPEKKEQESKPQK